ncbi:hypothetical protein LIER_43630 [Lithospermum erythrorhizon]|uniref:Uncharacterized protein n=1 Tax=Lithospermum erythrorhizon TaxID=34254 RepID=A0AAV3QG75_LITER
MRAPSLIAQCLPGLVTQDRAGHVATVCEKDVPLPSPAVEIVPSKTIHPFKYSAENVDIQGISILKVPFYNIRLGSSMLMELIVPTNPSFFKEPGSFYHFSCSVNMAILYKVSGIHK